MTKLTTLKRKESKQLVFQEKPLEVVTVNSQEWITSKALIAFQDNLL